MASETDHDPLGAWVAIKGPNTNINRRNCRRIVPMQCLSLGPSRTGTLSMQEAFSILGIPHPYHFSSVFANPPDSDMWVEALEAKFKTGKQLDWRSHFDQLLGHCGAVSDNPSATLWKELMDAYPEAKIVLVERDEDKWYKSACKLLEGTCDPFLRYVLCNTDPFWVGRVVKSGLLWTEGFFGTLNLAQAKKNALPAYRAHYAGIREHAAPGRILEYKLGSGWEPLCEFLGKEVPDVPFPHRNEAATLDLAFGALASRALKRSLVNLAVVVGLVAVVVKLLQRLLK